MFFQHLIYISLYNLNIDTVLSAPACPLSPIFCDAW